MPGTHMVTLPAVELAMLRAEAAEGRVARLMLLDMYRRQGGPVPCTIRPAEWLAAEAERQARLQRLLDEEVTGGNQEDED